ncbi:MAG: undecaprenyldiphospho-muramoylpentapeptide beta-N-acetylglucosaminyltransferase [Myxococcota bacterium]
MTLLFEAFFHVVLLAGGGTGGHVFPAVAVAQEIRRVSPETEVVFVGTERGLEARVVPRLGYPLDTLHVRHLKGGGLGGWARGLAALPRAGAEALEILRRRRPAAVISVGGYAAGPVTAAAAALGIPTALMEQNAIPGMTNRLLGRVVDECYVSFDQTCELLPEQAACRVLGNPVRRELLDAVAQKPSEGGLPVAERDRRQEFRIFITGGSGGAGPLNADLPILFRRLEAELAERLVIRHQAGRGRSMPVVDGYRGFGGQVEVVEFIDDMAEAYRWADLAICRAGATTLAELLVLGQPALLVPFAGAADDHQARNAEAATRAGAAVMVREPELRDGRAARLLTGLVRNPAALDNMRHQALKLARPDAGRAIAEAIVQLARLRQGPASHRAAPNLTATEGADP